MGKKKIENEKWEGTRREVRRGRRRRKRKGGRRGEGGGERIIESPLGACICRLGLVMSLLCFYYLTLEINSFADKSLLIKVAFNLQVGQGTSDLGW